MPPTALSTLFTDPQSVGGLLGATGIRLRLDDDATTSITVTGASNASPIVITTSAAHNLNTGDLIQISGVLGNTTANGIWYVIRLSSTTLSLTGSEGIGTYSSGGTAYGITYPESAYMAYSCNFGTSKVMRYTQTLYDTSDLATSWSVWNWATVCAAWWICTRRGNPPPGSLMNLYLESLDELTAVQKQEMVIEDIGYRNEVMPTWSALRVNQMWTIKKMRVETVLSNRNRPQYPQKQDYGAVLIGPAEPDSP